MNLNKILSLLNIQTELMFYKRFGKRLIDICISLSLLLLLLPLFAAITFLIIIFSGRPILFKQTRTGIFNSTFKIVKFRTMKSDFQKTKQMAYDWKEGVPNDFIFKSPKNSEVTKIGMLLRKTSLDELPQLINVLKGEMSLIGPRPEIPEITKYYCKKQMKRLFVKPGMTGWAQVNGRADSCHGLKIEHDLYYIKNLSLQLDLKILILTTLAIYKGNGAY